MGIVTENKATPAAEKVLANLISSLKSGASNAASSNGGFATLLAETATSFGRSQEAVESQALARREKDSAVREGGDERRSRGSERVCTQEERECPSQAAAAQEKQSVTKAGKDTKQEVSAVEKEAAPANEVDETVETQENESVSLVASAKTEETKEETVDEDMLALLAALVPLDGPASKKDTEAAVIQITEQVQALPEKENLEKPIEVLQNLIEIRQQIAQTGTKEEGEVSPDKAKGLSNALAQLMKDSGVSKETPVQTGKAALLSGEEKAGDAALAVLSSTVETAVEADPLFKQTAAQDMLDFFRKQGRQQAVESQKTQASLPTAQQGSTSVASAVIGAAQGIVEGASTSSPAQSGGATTSATQGIVAGGIKTAGIYDFASQLSAVRVTKGGATGLPQAVEQVAVQLHKAVKEGIDEMTIRLKPAELGKIEIKLAFGADNTVTGTVVADNQSTLNLLQKDSDSLHRALQEAGLQADAGSLEFSLRDNSGSNQFSGQLNDNSKSNETASETQNAELVAVDPSAIGQESYYLTPGRINIHV